MFNLDPGKLLVIAVVAIILLGPDKLPQVARQLGGAWRSFNEFRHRMESEVRSTMPDLPSTSEIARLARSPSALLNHLSNMSSDEDEDGAGGGEAPDGSFQPQGPPDGSAHPRAAADGAVADGAAHTNGANPNGAPTAESPVSDGSVPAPPAPAPAPVHLERPAPGPPPAPDVVVPGDPTLN